jgi:hypothetical protein
MEQDELTWSKHAKQHWLKDRDTNSKYFHACVNQRRQVNTITDIIDEGGVHRASSVDFEMAFVQYFEKLFTTTSLVGILDCDKCQILYIQPPITYVC